MAHQGQEAALQAQHKIQDQARIATTTAEQGIQKALFKSLAVAACVGLLTGLVTNWQMRKRRH